MANTVTKKRQSNSLKTMLVENDITTLSGSTYVTIIDAIDVESYERASIQMLANDGEALTCQVWGSLFDSAVAVPVTNSKWVQIGDDISVGASSGAIKSISTTGLKRLCVVARDSASNTQTFPIGDCVVFAQGTI